MVGENTTVTQKPIALHEEIDDSAIAALKEDVDSQIKHL